MNQVLLSAKIVELDHTCRQQQVNDGCFPNFDAVPKHAISLTIPVFRRAKNLSVVVPGPRKAAAVRATLSGRGVHGSRSWAVAQTGMTPPLPPSGHKKARAGGERRAGRGLGDCVCRLASLPAQGAGGLLGGKEYPKSNPCAHPCRCPCHLLGTA